MPLACRLPSANRAFLDTGWRTHPFIMRKWIGVTDFPRNRLKPSRATMRRSNDLARPSNSLPPPEERRIPFSWNDATEFYCNEVVSTVASASPTMAPGVMFHKGWLGAKKYRPIHLPLFYSGRQSSSGFLLLTRASRVKSANIPFCTTPPLQVPVHPLLP